MTYEEIFEKSKEHILSQAPEGLEGHLAVQVNIIGEGQGSFYIELLNGKVYVEPYEYYEGETVVGIDASMAQAICDKLGYKLVIDDMDFDSIITAVQTGKADFGMAGMTVTEERLQAINFSDSYTTATQVIIVKE